MPVSAQGMRERHSINAGVFQEFQQHQSNLLTNLFQESFSLDLHLVIISPLISVEP